MRSVVHITLAAALIALPGCAKKPQYGTEQVLTFLSRKGAVWAVAPAVNLSGERAVDPLLQADLLYQQLQDVRGLTVVPVNRVAEAYAAARIEQVQSPEQAAIVCDLLGCDALVVPTVTAYDPYDPPKFGGSLQLFHKPGDYARAAAVDVRALARAAAPPPDESVPSDPVPGLTQAVGMFDAANGSVREALWGYAKGRHDPVGAMGRREYLMSMDRYAGFAYHTLIEDLLREVERGDARAAAARAGARPGRPTAG